MSDIWDEFEKIAVAQGLAIADEDDQKQENPSEMPTRYDSLTDDAIRLLYGLEPETIFKNKNIIEEAHPETAVVGRAYDAMNSVVENVNQRQDIMTYIALKQPNGHLSNRRYVVAKQELLNSLVRAAFTLDNKDELELMSFADNCISQLSEKDNKIVKEAFPFLVAGAALLLGAAYYSLYGATSIQNVYANANQVIEALKPVMDKPYATGIYDNVSKLMTMAENIYKVKDQLTEVKSANIALNAAQSEVHKAKVQVINNQIQDYIKQLKLVHDAIPQWVSKIKIAHKGDSESSSSDWWSKLTGLVEPFIWDKAETLIDKLWGKSKILGYEQIGEMFGSSTEGTGGLYAAIKEDIKYMNAAINNANTEISKEIQTLEQVSTIQTPKPEILQTPISKPEFKSPKQPITNIKNEEPSIW